MRRFIPLVVALTLFQLAFGFYIYGKGEVDGVAYYKRSKSFMLTLYSMYMYGVRDGCDACRGGKK